MMDDSDDSDVILIDSDDNAEGDCCSRGEGGSIINGDTAIDINNSTSNYSFQQQKKTNRGAIDINTKDVECIDLDNSDDDNKSCCSSSSSSSSSSGIPSPLFKTKSSVVVHSPPSIIHIKSPSVTNSVNRAVAKKKGLSNNHKQIYKEDEDDNDMMSCCYTDMSTTTTSSISNKDTKGKKYQAKQQSKPKKRQWNNRKRSTTKKLNDNTTTDTSMTAAASTTSSKTTTISKTKKKKASNTDEATTSKHFHCYLLRSINPDHPYKTYIGFTTHPQRRIRQHNGILKAGGARKTKRAGRPWTFVCVIHGFQDKITALQFEWAWQNVDKSKAFREAVGDDKLAKKMKRRYGPKARLEELHILLKECLPFCLYSLTVYFPEKEYHDIFSGILRRGKNGNPYKKDDGDCQSEAYEPLMNIEVCSLENMPMAKEVTALKEKKQAKRDAAKALKQQRKKKGKAKKGKKKAASSSSSDWLSDENTKDDDESCWTDLIEEDDDEEETSNNNNNLETIQEKRHSSINLCDDDSSMCSDDDEGSLSGESSSNHKMSHDGVDAISKDLFSLSMKDSSKKKHASMPAANKQSRDDTDECDFSTISSKSSDDNSDCCLDDDDICAGSTSNSSTTRRQEKGNEPASSSSNHMSKKSSFDDIATGSSMSEVVDLCDSP